MTLQLEIIGLPVPCQHSFNWGPQGLRSSDQDVIILLAYNFSPGKKLVCPCSSKLRKLNAEAIHGTQLISYLQGIDDGISVLELGHSGPFIKLPSSATEADFVGAATSADAPKAVAVLLSLVVQHGGLKQVLVPEMYVHLPNESVIGESMKSNCALASSKIL